MFSPYAHVRMHAFNDQRMSLRLARMHRPARARADVACVPRLRLHQSFVHMLSFDAVWFQTRVVRVNTTSQRQQAYKSHQPTRCPFPYFSINRLFASVSSRYCLMDRSSSLIVSTSALSRFRMYSRTRLNGASGLADTIWPNKHTHTGEGCT